MSEKKKTHQKPGVFMYYTVSILWYNNYDILSMFPVQSTNLIELGKFH